jgi:hypothetical protein
MVCSNCGTQLPNAASYCWHCGVPQRPGLSPPMLERETCEIEFKTVKVGRRTQIVFWAKAYGPKGTYFAGESTPFDGEYDGAPFQAGHKMDVAEGCLQDLIQRLLKDGWEYETRGPGYWQRLFHRWVRP